MFKRILLAFDGSDHSKQELPAAIEIAKKFDGFVFVLHVASTTEAARPRTSSRPPARRNPTSS